MTALSTPRTASTTTSRGSRARRRIATTGLLAALGLTVGATPALAASGTVDTTGAPVTVRSAPSTTSTSVGSLADGAKVTITCQTYGTSVTGTFGTSTIWDKLSTGGYVSDAYVYTGTDGLAAPLCGTSVTTTNPLLNYADNYIGRYAKYACIDAGMAQTAGTWQCKQFVSCAVYKAYRRNIQGGYYAPYLNNGFRKVSKADARPGDIVQLNKPTNREGFYSGMHTAILAAPFGGDNSASVVDSNYGGDARGSELVRRHEWDPFARAARYGFEVNIFRYVG
jgi:uncharacterized protein YraI